MESVKKPGHIIPTSLGLPLVIRVESILILCSQEILVDFQYRKRRVT